jgi:hypothetical protein
MAEPRPETNASALHVELLPVRAAAFFVDASQSAKSVEVRMSGNADSVVLDVLERFLRDLHGEACRVGASEIKLDIRELYFLNSSCMKLMVTWFTSLRELEPSKRYRVVVLSSPKLHWQRRSFDALRYIADGLVTIR